MAQGRTFDQGQRARELYDKGLGCNAIAKELGVSASTISAWAKSEGLAFDESRSEVAVNARRTSRAARRSDIIDRLYDRTEHLLDRLEADEFKTLASGEYGASSTMTLDYVPTADEKNIAATINVYLDRAAKLELVDDADGVAEADSMLGRLARRFGLVE